MRLRHPDGTTVHLSYCTNVHPAETLEGIEHQLRRYAGPVRTALGVPVLGVGLWLAAAAARRLAQDPAARAGLQTLLDELGLEVVTLNAFPYAAFHDREVKLRVYRPDWSESERLGYTLDCARVLADLLPDDVGHGTVSTVPFGWRDPWPPARHEAARQALTRLDEELARLAEQTGRVVRVGLEPEPGCVMDTLDDVLEKMPRLELVGLCLDACHLATGLEELSGGLSRLEAACLSVVKLQASAALVLADPSAPQGRVALQGYAEERFVHQVRTATSAGVVGRDDLPLALKGEDPLPTDGPWVCLLYTSPSPRD